MYFELLRPTDYELDRLRSKESKEQGGQHGLIYKIVTQSEIDWITEPVQIVFFDTEYLTYYYPVIIEDEGYEETS